MSALAAVLFVCAVSTSALAEGAQSMSLAHARNAWDRGDVAGSETAYKQAIEAGELAPSEVVESYVRIGCARVLLGKRDSAVNAFRAAAVLDPTFAVPDEAGQKAAQLATQAKRDVSKFGGISLSMTAPEKTPIGKPFTVSIDLDRAHVNIVKKLAVVAKDGSSGHEFRHEEPPAEHVEFEVPADITLPSANLTVRIDALDSYNNRIATHVTRVKVPDGPKKAALATAAVPDKDKKESKGFWSTPWPYVIGGAILASAGTAAYFQFRPTDDVNITAVSVHAR